MREICMMQRRQERFGGVALEVRACGVLFTSNLDYGISLTINLSVSPALVPVLHYLVNDSFSCFSFIQSFKILTRCGPNCTLASNALTASKELTCHKRLPSSHTVELALRSELVEANVSF